MQGNGNGNGNGNGKIHFKDCYELTKLPYFRLNEKAKLAVDIEDLPPIVDVHTHLVFSALKISPQFNLNLKTQGTRHSFRTRSVPVDISVYSGVNLKNERRGGMFGEYAKTLVSNKGAMATYTVPNIIEEMDRMGVAKSILLAIDPPGSHHVSLRYIEACQETDRLIPFCGVNPRSKNWRDHIDECVEKGAKGLKVHPYLQWMPPNDERVLDLLGHFGQYNLPVIFHTAHNGLEPAVLRDLSDIELYEEALKRYPEITFILGHSGMAFHKEAARMAKEHGNTYLEIGGQPPEDIKWMIDYLGPDKLLYGSDWPVYPFILPLSKLFIATDGDKKIRDMILSGNAMNILKQAQAV